MKKIIILIVVLILPFGSISAPSDFFKALRKQPTPAPRRIFNETASPRTSIPLSTQKKPSYQAKSREISNSRDTIKLASGGKYFRYTDHVDFNKLNNRGWNVDSVDKLISRPYTIRQAGHTYDNNYATAFFRRDGHYVVRDNRNQKLIHVSNTNKPIGKVAGDTHWKTEDELIIDPYIPKGAPGY